jgi:hypothetical protein
MSVNGQSSSAKSRGKKCCTLLTPERTTKIIACKLHSTSYYYELMPTPIAFIPVSYSLLTGENTEILLL